MPLDSPLELDVPRVVLRPDSLSDDIYLSVRQRVLNGHFLPGQSVAVAAACTFFDCSRTPVREAFAILKDEGYLCQDPRGFHVVKLENARVLDSVSFRTIWLRYACQKVVERAPQNSLQTLRDMLQISLTSASIGPDAMEDLTQQGLSVVFRILSLSGIENVTVVYNLCFPAALNRFLIRAMSSQDVRAFATLLHELVGAIYDRSADEDIGKLLAELESTAKAGIAYLKLLETMPATGDAIFEVQPASRSLVHVDSDDHPYIGLGRREFIPY